MSRIIIVPGLAVRSYARPAGEAVASHGHRVGLAAAPAWRGAPATLDRFGQVLARAIDGEGHDVDLLVGLSVGTQAVAVAASRSRRIRRLLLVSPTVDPRVRTRARLLHAWLAGDERDGAPGFRRSLPDWARAGLPRIARGFDSALRAQPLELLLPRVRADVTVLHAEHDSLGSVEWARIVADAGGGRLIEKAGAPHSWPVDDPSGFAALVDELIAA